MQRAVSMAYETDVVYVGITSIYQINLFVINTIISSLIQFRSCI